MTTEVAIKEVNYYVRSDQNKKSAIKIKNQLKKAKIKSWKPNCTLFL